ncbi:MAG TPA: hypothetical protein VLF39_04660 [Candidatus Saccharimonadales bacterium]|nr:hypothetical protein [Candidatus Saccharimonadales bacterium]
MSRKQHDNTGRDGMKIKGMFRLQIDESGNIIGDSGWKENLITNVGYLNIVNQLGTSLTGSKISHAALGTGGAPNATDTTQSGEVSTNGSGSVVRAAVTAATSSTSKTLRHTATFSSANSFITASANISNIGLWQTSGPTTASGSLMAGNTYTSSALATNQNVNITYDIIFS